MIKPTDFYLHWMDGSAPHHIQGDTFTEACERAGIQPQQIRQLCFFTYEPNTFVYCVSEKRWKRRA